MFSQKQLLLLVSMAVPISALAVATWTWRWRRGFNKERAPVAEKLLRPAGESLRLQLEELDEKFNEALMWAFFGPGFLTAFLILSDLSMKHSAGHTVAAIIVGAGSIWFAFQVRQVVSLIERRRNCRLGFAGERAVAEELNLLMLEGCRIFHDVPMEPYGNIDHVILARNGIYAVETKARRKRKAPAGHKEHEVIFDGSALLFSGRVETKPIEQARQQANRLGVFLGKAVGESISVHPILTFPGWFVTSRARADVRVLNPKQIRAAVLDRRMPHLAQQLLNRIAHQLDQKCRDVAF